MHKFINKQMHIELQVIKMKKNKLEGDLTSNEASIDKTKLPKKEKVKAFVTWAIFTGAYFYFEGISKIAILASVLLAIGLYWFAILKNVNNYLSSKDVEKDNSNGKSG